MSAFFEDIFNKQQCRFLKGYNTQQCLLKMLEKWKRSVDEGKVFGALLTDLSKAFDCLDHELLIAKLKGALSGLRQFLAAESLLEMMKNAFYFTSKALLVLKISKFLS